MSILAQDQDQGAYIYLIFQICLDLLRVKILSKIDQGSRYIDQLETE